jgi:epoxyqueuosine reductase
MPDLVSEIKSKAFELGFNVAGISSVSPLTNDDLAFQNWCAAGFAADMEYMTRRPELHAHPKTLVPYSQSVITLAADYYFPAPAFEHQGRFGRIARYAWGLDYHDVVKPRLLKLVAEIETLAGHGVRARCFVDAVPLLERAVAANASLGFFGKNTNLLRPKGGSWFFLSEILLDLELSSDEIPIKVSCGTCRRCLEACPTDAFVSPYVLDSGKCISYLTIENKGAIAPELRRGIGEWIFGCDVCQEVCPFNRFAADTKWPEFHPDAGAGTRLDLVEVLSIDTDARFRERFRGTPLTRPKRRGLLRNAAVVAANIGATSSVPMLIERVEQDPEPLIRSHCLWSLGQLDRTRALAIAERAVKQDNEPIVQGEAERILEEWP